MHREQRNVVERPVRANAGDRNRWTVVRLALKWWTATSMVFLASVATAQTDMSVSDAAFFESKVRPLLVEHCYECHGPDSEKGEAGLRVDSLGGLLRGGDSGAAIVPGKPAESMLIDAVNYGDVYQMPPDGKLSQPKRDILTRWVADGAKWPGADANDELHDADHAGGVDVFSEQRTSHWAFQPRHTVPPPSVNDSAWPQTPVDNFVLNKLQSHGLTPAPPADKLTLLRRVTFDLTGLPPTPEEIDAFLDDDSPDAFRTVVQRLLDSPQYGVRWGRHWLDVARYADAAGHESDFAYRLLWRYRDYVIDSFNADKPYDQFVVEQLAGDLLPKTNDTQRNLDQVVATGFLQVGPKPVSERDKEQMFLEIVDEQLNATGSAFMGLTLGCARCHDHKFDPVSALDYYSMAGIFMSTKSMADTLPDSMWLESVARGPNGLVSVMSVVDAAKPKNMHVYLRGNYKTKGEEAPRRFLSIIDGRDSPPLDTSGSGRLELARWIASPENPLTARVMVNRIWKHHFGAGIVATTDNFGLQGALPNHPELLDYLAERFVESGWSVKEMHRLIVLSRTYQQAYVEYEAASAVDPENNWLWRMPRRRLAAEELRDAMLAASGELDTRLGGSLLLYRDGWGRPRRYPAEDRIYKVANYGFRIRHEHYPSYFRPRRTVYLPRPRLFQSQFTELFDGPSVAAPDGQRNESTVAPQSLFFMNSFFARETARQFADDLLAGAESDEQRLRQAYQRTLARPPRNEELRRDIAFLDAYRLDAGEESRRASNDGATLPSNWASYDQIVRSTDGLLAYYRLNELDEREDPTRPNVAVNSHSPGHADGVYYHSMKWRKEGGFWPDGLFADVAFGRWGAIDLDLHLSRRNTAVGFNIPYEWPYDDESDTRVERGHRMQVDDVAPLESKTGQLSVEYWVEPINLLSGTVIARDGGEQSNQRMFRSGIEVRKIGSVECNVVYYEIVGNGNGGRRYADRDSAFFAEPAKWTHVAFTVGDGWRRLYINGRLADEFPISGKIVGQDAPLTFAALPDQSDWYAGIIDEVAIYDSVLTLEQIQLRHDAATGKLYERLPLSPDQIAWTAYCQALMSCNEFIFVD